MREDLIEELRSGFDTAAPEEMPRELARLCALCDEAANELEQAQKLNKALADSIQWVNEDPYKVLSRINVNDHIEKRAVKNKKTGETTYLSYLSWAWAWDTLMGLYPDSYTTINRPTDSDFPYWTDGRTCWVDVSVTLVWNGNERVRSEVFPIMGYSNQSIPLDAVTSFDVNTALQRAWTKCIARHGLGFYIYAGQDLPNEEAEQQKARQYARVTDEQVAKVMELYSPAEIETMLKRLKKTALVEISQAQADKMIAKRDQSLLKDNTETF
jgi:hypothetical protein